MTKQKLTHGDILKMVRQIVAEAKPVKVILFGSYARGSARPDSDVDLLVIERDPVAQRRESVRLRRLLKDFKVPIDVVVFGQAFAERYADIPGSVLYPAFREGKVLYGE
jgi:predicted nucleotidyltransferase